MFHQLLTPELYKSIETNCEIASSEHTSIPSHINARSKTLNTRVSSSISRCTTRKSYCNAFEHDVSCVYCRFDKLNCLTTESDHSSGVVHANTQDSEPKINNMEGSSKSVAISSVDIQALANGTVNPFDLMNVKPGKWRDVVRHTHDGFGGEDVHLSRCFKAHQNRLFQSNSGFVHGHTNAQVGNYCLPAYFKPLPSNMDREDICYLQKTGALSVPEKSFRIALLESYIEYVHPYMPVLELHDFIQIISQNSEQRVSLLLFQAVMFTGSAFVDMALLISAGFPSRKAARKVLYQKAKILYELDYERDCVSLMQSLLLMSHWYETPNNYKDATHWLSIAISLAYKVGMHRNQETSSLSFKNQGLWKRIWWSCFMRDQLVALETGGRTRIDKAKFDVRMLTTDDFEIEALANNSQTISSTCTVMWDIQMQRDLAALCTSKAELCLHIGEISQSLLLSQDGSNWAKAAKHSYDGLTKWLMDLPISCQYQEPTAAVVKNGRSCIFVHRALLHMLYFAVDSAIREQYFLQTAEVAAQRFICDRAEHSSDASLRLAADQITGIAKDLVEWKLEQYLPASGVTVLFYATNIHVLDIRSSDDVISKRAMLGFGECMAAMESLRAIYTLADYAYRLALSKQQGHFRRCETKTKLC